MKVNGNIIKGIIFDLDGTLFDSCSIWHEVDKEFFLKRNKKLPDGYAEAIGHLGLDKAADYTINNYFPNEKKEDIIKEWKNAVLSHYANEVKLKPYAKEFLKHAKEEGIHLCAATANDEDCYKSCLINNGIYDYFDFILDVSLFKHGKEKPDIYLASAKKLKLNVNECAVFEDLLLALKTAKEVGFKCVAVYEETCQDEEQKKKIADMYITDYKDIIDI